MKKEIPQLQRLELNKQNVMKILFDCKASENTKTPLQSTIYSEESSRKAPPITFDFEKLYDNKFLIGYLLGQIKGVHLKRKTLTPADGYFNYKNEQWTTEPNTLIALYYLSTACHLIPRFVDGEKTAIIDDLKLYYDAGLKPTYAPSDPNFNLKDARSALKYLGVDIDELI